MNVRKFSDSENFCDSGSMILWHWCRDFVTLMSCFSNSGAVRWNSVEIEFQNPSLAARPRPSASLIISVNLLIKMSCKRFPSFHSDHYQHARAARGIPQHLTPSSAQHTRLPACTQCTQCTQCTPFRKKQDFFPQSRECFESAWISF